MHGPSRRLHEAAEKLLSELLEFQPPLSGLLPDDFRINVRYLGQLALATSVGEPFVHHRRVDLQVKLDRIDVLAITEPLILIEVGAEEADRAGGEVEGVSVPVRVPA